MAENSGRIEAARRDMAAKQNKLLRAVALEAEGRMIARTPVDTGRARANWNTTTGSPDQSVSDSTSPKSGAGVIAAADFAGGDVVFIANGVPYMEFLEDGSSKQAPNGMIALTMAEMTPFAEKIARTLASEASTKES